MSKRLAFFLAAALLLAGSAGHAASIFSPLGIGVPLRNTTARSAALAGSDLALADSIHFPLLNPASWASEGRTRFQVTALAGRTIGEDSYGTDISDDFGFSSMSIAMPIFRSVGMGLSYNRHTDYRFLVFDDTSYTSPEPIDSLDSYSISQRFQGEGGLASAGARFGFRPRSWLAIGAGADYYFGTNDRLWTATFQEGSFSRGGRFSSDEFAGWAATVGISLLPEGRWRGSVAVRLPATLDVVQVTKIEGGDSLQTSGLSYDLPLDLRLGGSFRFGRLRLSGAGSYAAWEQAERDVADNGVYTNSWTLGLGLERLPDLAPLVPWYERWLFRGGLRASQSYVEVNGEPLQTVGAALGMGIPLRSHVGMLDIALTADMRGSLDANEARELIFGLQVGIASTERWFVPRRR